MADEKNPVNPETGDDVDDTLYKAKLTISQIGGSPERAKTEKTRVAVASFIGIATGTRMIENIADPTQPYTAITGNFEGTNLYTGEVYRSGVLYLPSGMHDLIVGMLEELKNDDERSKFDKPSVQFALQIDAEPADNPSGYCYVAKSLLPKTAERADPLAAIRNRAHRLLPKPAKKLAAPTPAAAD